MQWETATPVVLSIEPFSLTPPAPRPWFWGGGGLLDPPPPPPKTVQSAEGGEGKDKRERIIVVVRSPCQDNDPADAHPSALKSVLESANARTDSEGACGCT